MPGETDLGWDTWRCAAVTSGGRVQLERGGGAEGVSQGKGWGGQEGMQGCLCVSLGVGICVWMGLPSGALTVAPEDVPWSQTHVVQGALRAGEVYWNPPSPAIDSQQGGRPQGR